MADGHYHANHIDAPARGSKAAALKDARRLHVTTYSLHHPRVAGDIVGAEQIREHGSEFPSIVRCFHSDCQVQR